MNTDNITTEKALQIIFASDELTHKLADLTYEHEMDYLINDLIICWKGSRIDYCFDLCGYSYVKFDKMENYEVIEGAEEKRDSYGVSTKTEQAIKMARATQRTNLGEYYCDRLRELLSSELMEEWKFIDELYSKALGHDMQEEYFHEEVENNLDYFLDDIDLDDDGTITRTTTKTLGKIA